MFEIKILLLRRFFLATSFKNSSKLKEQVIWGPKYIMTDFHNKAELLQEGIFFLIHLFARDVLVL